MTIKLHSALRGTKSQHQVHLAHLAATIITWTVIYIANHEYLIAHIQIQYDHRGAPFRRTSSIKSSLSAPAVKDVATFFDRDVPTLCVLSGYLSCVVMLR